MRSAPAPPVPHPHRGTLQPTRVAPGARPGPPVTDARHTCTHRGHGTAGCRLDPHPPSHAWRARTPDHGEGRQPDVPAGDGEVLGLHHQAKVPRPEQVLQRGVVALRGGKSGVWVDELSAQPSPCPRRRQAHPPPPGPRAPALASLPAPNRRPSLTSTASSSTARMQGRLCSAFGLDVCGGRAR